MDDPHGFNNPFLLDDNPPDWDTWDEVPALLQLRVDAAPFAGERVASIIPADFLAVECAVDMLRRDIAHTLGEPMLANPIGREFYSV